MSLLPAAGTGHVGKQFAASAHAGGGRCGKRNHSLAEEIIAFNKIVHRPRGNAPPNWIVKWSTFPLCLNFTGLNNIQKCVLCYFQFSISLSPYT